MRCARGGALPNPGPEPSRLCHLPPRSFWPRHRVDRGSRTRHRVYGRGGDRRPRRPSLSAGGHRCRDRGRRIGGGGDRRTGRARMVAGPQERLSLLGGRSRHRGSRWKREVGRLQQDQPRPYGTARDGRGRAREPGTVPGDRRGRDRLRHLHHGCEGPDRHLDARRGSRFGMEGKRGSGPVVCPHLHAGRPRGRGTRAGIRRGPGHRPRRRYPLALA